MVDIFTPEKRSYIMSRIRSKDTKIEFTMIKILKKNKIKFQRHPKILGTPDFKVGKNTLIFCDGDFWHGYDYRNGRALKQKFWRDKIERNMERDGKISRKLRSEGWSVIRLWEHDIKKRPDYCIRKITRFMR